MIRACLAAIVCVGLAGDADALIIVSPVPGTVVTPGQTVTVTVAASPGEVLTRVALATSDEVYELPPGDLQGSVTIPKDSVGPDFIVAFATRTSGLASVANVEVVVAPGPLDTLDVAAPSPLTFIGEVQQLNVTGLFADGIARDLTHPDRGTSYLSSNLAVLAVNSTGVIQARSRGTAQVAVSSHGRARVVTVLVAVPSPPDNRIPVPDAGADITAPSVSLVRLDGSASSDADGDPIVFRWAQESGPGVILRNGETAAPQFVAPRVSEDTVLEFSLFVVDSRGAHSFQDVVRVTVQPSQP